jgi:hypothetical protein
MVQPTGAQSYERNTLMRAISELTDEQVAIRANELWVAHGSPEGGVAEYLPTAKALLDADERCRRAETAIAHRAYRNLVKKTANPFSFRQSFLQTVAY